MPSPLSLSATECRVLGVLVEKQRTVPDSYPMTLNDLIGGCKQKTSREPIMDLDEAQVLAALDGLRQHTLIVESSGGRVPRFGHNMERVLGIPTQSAALLAVLMLRGPQTAGELRQNCERLHRFADISATEAFLEELASHRDGALAKLLPRQPGSREPRWQHTLLSGDPGVAMASEPEDPVSMPYPASSQEIDLLRADIALLRQELVELRARLDRLDHAD